VWSLVAEHVKHAGGLLSHPIPKRRVKQLSADFVPQCSNRLAKRTGDPSAVVQQTQHNLMRKLGLVSGHEVMGPKAREDYGCLFNKPLSQSHVEALASLFGWHVPDMEQAKGEGDVLVQLASLEA
jgi:hypothetical protein